MQKTFFIGIDIGATRIKTGLVTHDGTLVSKDNFETSRLTSPGHFLEISKRTIDLLMKTNDIERKSIGGIGVGAPGWTSYSDGVVHELTNIPGWHDIPLATLLRDETGFPAFVDNDANVMATGELIHGAGRGYRHFICLTLGTGVGGSIVTEGNIWRGVHGLAGEIGHMSVDLNGPHCACGARGCLERYVGNRFIVENALAKLKERSPSGGENTITKLSDGNPKNVTPELLSEAAALGDDIAIRVWEETGHYLGVALAVLVNVLNPECFIIGGGVAKAGEFLFGPIRRTMEALAMNRLGEKTKLLKARLEADAGIIGAATFARNCAEISYRPS